MDIDNQRRSSNFEDRGGGGGGGGGGLLGMAAFGIFRMFGIRGILIAALLLGGVYLFGGDGLRSQIFGGGAAGGAGQGGQTCATAAQACDFSRAILGSTEDVWKTQFEQSRLPDYGHPTTQYTDPKLIVYSGSVQTGCGGATSSVGPFYCPEDTNLYVDPSFYQVMADRLHAPGDFAQAYVIAHEVGHHVQKLIGAMEAGPQETQNQHSVRIELQADCFAGVWGHTAQATLHIDDADLREALNAAHNIGDDTLQSQAGGGVNPAQFTHGTSEQRMRWFHKGFDTGDARQCDTMQGGYDQL